MATRSRNGCKTCRTRKLKCDQTKPVCNNCQKSRRECIQSEPIAFRHQQNAGLDASADENSLDSFYKYKNQFSESQLAAFLPLPPQLIWVPITDVYAVDDHDVIATQASLAANAQYSAQQAAHSGLNALSDAAGQYQPATSPYETAYPPNPAYAQIRTPAHGGGGQHNNIGFLLNPPNTTPSSVIDPNLEGSETEVTDEHREAVDETDETAQQVALALKSMG